MHSVKRDLHTEIFTERIFTERIFTERSFEGTHLEDGLVCADGLGHSVLQPELPIVPLRPPVIKMLQISKVKPS